MKVDLNTHLDQIHAEIADVLSKYGKVKADRDLLLGMCKLAVATINSGTGTQELSCIGGSPAFALKLMKLCTMLEQTIADVEKESK